MSSNDERPATTARGFDVRTIIGSLLGVYAVVLLVMGLFFTSAEELTRADGVNLNVWTGIGLGVATAVFLVWVRLRPLVVTTTADGELVAKGAEGTAGAEGIGEPGGR